MTFGEFMELTGDAQDQEILLVDVHGRYVEVIDVKAEGKQIVITIED